MLREMKEATGHEPVLQQVLSALYFLHFCYRILSYVFSYNILYSNLVTNALNIVSVSNKLSIGLTYIDIYKNRLSVQAISDKAKHFWQNKSNLLHNHSKRLFGKQLTLEKY